MNYQNTIKFIEEQDWKGSVLGLDRMIELMNKLNNPQDKLKFIHVAGTNGKGSCCATLSSILMKAGYKVGTYTSPHLIKYEERFVINGKEISEDDLCRVAAKVKKAAEKMNDKPTVFEVVTAIGFEYFYEQKCDVVVLEVGMGGRLDATNIIKNPLLCVIMNIGLEHTEILGKTLSKIAYEKAGIIKDNSDVVVYDNSKQVIQTIKKVAKQRNANLHLSNFNELVIKEEGMIKQVFDYKNYKNIEISLLGKHQFNNAAVVLECIEVLKSKGYKISETDIKKGLLKTKWDARLSILCKEPLFILDGAHNPQCAESLRDSLPKILKNKKAIVLCGMLADKDYSAVMDMMIPFAKEFVCLTPFSNRALPAKELANVLKGKGQKAVAVDSVEEGIEICLKKANSKGVVLAFGSLYLAGFIEEKFPKVYKKWKTK